MCGKNNSAFFKFFLFVCFLNIAVKGSGLPCGLQPYADRCGFWFVWDGDHPDLHRHPELHQQDLGAAGGGGLGSGGTYPEGN